MNHYNGTYRSNPVVNPTFYVRKLRLERRNIGNRLVSMTRVIIYERKMFIRLGTGLIDGQQQKF